MSTQNVSRLARGVHVEVMHGSPLHLHDLPESSAESFFVAIRPAINSISDVYRVRGAATSNLAFEYRGQEIYTTEWQVLVDSLMYIAPAPRLHVGATQLSQFFDGLIQRVAQQRCAGFAAGVTCVIAPI